MPLFPATKSSHFYRRLVRNGHITRSLRYATRERERERERRNERNGRKLFGSTFFLTVTAAAADVATCGGRANYIYICGNGELHYTR